MSRALQSAAARGRSGPPGRTWKAWARLCPVAVAVVVLGCQKQESTPPASEAIPQFAGNIPADKAPRDRSSVEIDSADAVLEDGIVHFTIHYRFTSGPPHSFYLFNIAFPGTERYGVKPVEAQELQVEGDIETLIEVGNDPVETFEITMSEAFSPDQGYFLISNTLTGTVQRPELPEPPAPDDKPPAAEAQ